MTTVMRFTQDGMDENVMLVPLVDATAVPDVKGYAPALEDHADPLLVNTFPEVPGDGPVRVNVPDVVTGPPVKVNPDTVELALTLVTVPDPETVAQDPSPRK